MRTYLCAGSSDSSEDSADLLASLSVLTLYTFKLGFELVGVLCGEWPCRGVNGGFAFAKGGLGLNFKVSAAK